MSSVTRAAFTEPACAMPPAHVALLAGLGTGVLMQVVSSAAFHALDIPVVAALEELFGALGYLLPVGAPLMLWSWLHRERSARARVLAGLTLLVASWAVSFELAPRFAMAVMRNDLPDWSTFAISLMRPNTWSTMGFIEYGGAAEPGVMKMELLRRGYALAILLAAMLPLASARVPRSASRLAVPATLGCMFVPLVMPGPITGFLAAPLIVLGCALVVMLRPPFDLPSAPRRAVSWLPAAVAGALTCVGFLAVVKSCQIGVLAGSLMARLGW